MTITVRVPATSANLGPGFDTIGLALNLHNTFTFSEIPFGLDIRVTGEGAINIPRDEKNLVYRAAQRIFRLVNRVPSGLQIMLNNKVPSSSGMGSSSTAIVAGMLGANALIGNPLTRLEILRLATLMEGHPDNVMPAICGGLTLGVIDGDSVIADEIRIPSMRVVIVLPKFDLLTSESRAALPTVIPMSDAIHNIGRTALLIRALEQGNYEKLRVATQDRLHQPYRLPLIPGLREAFKAAREAGAAGVALSGAGPSLIAFAENNHNAIARAAQHAFQSNGVTARRWVLDVSMEGATISGQ